MATAPEVGKTKWNNVITKGTTAIEDQLEAIERLIYLYGDLDGPMGILLAEMATRNGIVQRAFRELRDIGNGDKREGQS